METFLNVAALFFMVSGMAAWGAGLLLTWYYWLCQPRKEK
jgi:hypothetical protein